MLSVAPRLQGTERSFSMAEVFRGKDELYVLGVVYTAAGDEKPTEMFFKTILTMGPDVSRLFDTPNINQVLVYSRQEKYPGLVRKSIATLAKKHNLSCKEREIQGGAMWVLSPK